MKSGLSFLAQFGVLLNSIQVHFGAPWPTSLAAVVRTKVQDAKTIRKIALEGHRFTPQEALDGGIIDVIAGAGTSEAVFQAARGLAAEKSLNAKTGVWGLIKVCISVTFCAMLKNLNL